MHKKVLSKTEAMKRRLNFKIFFKLQSIDESEDNIPEDWKDNGEIVIKHIQPCQITTNLQESVKPWTQPIPEVSEEETSETEPEIMYLQNNNSKKQE